MAKNLARSIYISQDKPVEGIIKGSIPKWLNGTLFRNGPGRFRFGDKTYNNYFDGMACVNKFQILNGKVYFSNKLLETQVLKKTLETKILYPMFGARDPCSKLFSRFKVFFRNNNVNVNILPFANNQLYALNEANMIVRLDPKNLNIINSEDIKKHIKSTVTTLAHPHIEEDGSWINIGMNPKGQNMSYEVIKLQAATSVQNACENIKLIGRIPSSHKFALSYFHSFGLSANYIIFLEQGVFFHLGKTLWNIVVNKSLSTAIQINKDFKTKIHLIDRKTGQLLPQKFYTDPQFTFHHINAFETNLNDPSKSELLIDICSHNIESFQIDAYKYDENDEEEIQKLFDNTKARLRRIRVPLHETKSNNEKIYCEIKDIVSDAYMELPTINYFKYNTKPYNYAYGIGSTQSPFSIIKINVNKHNDYKIAVIKTNNRIIAPSEPIFVENPNAKSEDDGVILTVVLGDTYDSLIVLDAKTLEEIGRAELPENIKATFTFHGFFADENNFKKLVHEF